VLPAAVARRRHVHVVVAIMEHAVAEAELDRTRCRNAELEERLRQQATEARHG
jgi:E3 ubiquitin-protein ligase BOI-like protein